jgi:hypothetical protein
MELNRTLRLDRLPRHLVSHLDARDAAVWVLEPFVAGAGGARAAEIMRLPWRLALTESSDPTLLEELDRAEDVASPLVRRRGFIHLIDTIPTDVMLPPHSLPVYLLNGRGVGPPVSNLAAMTRRLTMLESLRRIQVKELFILAGNGLALPPELTELWNDGLRTLVTVVSDSPQAEAQVEAWRNARPFGTAVAYLPSTSIGFCRELLEDYLSRQADDRIALRIRNADGEIKILDITGLDDPEHPLLANYGLLQDRDLRPIQPDDLKIEEALDFFRDAASSWRPYAAGMPWQRDEKAEQVLRSILKRLDRDGPDAGRIAYINAESGSGGTTLMRTLACTAAQEGYPTLVAHTAPFILGDQIAILAAGKGDDGGVDGLNRRLNAARQIADADRGPDGSLRYRFIGLYDNDRAGRRGVSSACEFDRRLRQCGDLFLLHPIMPLANGADHGTLRRRFDQDNAPFKGLDWEIEDLFSDQLFSKFEDVRPAATLHELSGGGRKHRELTREGKFQLHEFVKKNACLEDLIEVVKLIRALRDYHRLPIGHIIC